jgi:hypothetical protein
MPSVVPDWGYPLYFIGAALCIVGGVIYYAIKGRK